MRTDYAMIKALRRGVGRLSTEAAECVTGYVRSQMAADCSFMNRAGRSDLYYTMFGWMLCYALGIATDKDRRRQYLAGIDTAALDPLHRMVFTQTQLLDSLLRYGLAVASVLNLPHHNHLKDFFSNYHRHASTHSLNSSAALIMAGSRWMGNGERERALQDILQLQDPDTGGFRQTADTAMPDILSTAVALFTLKCCGMRPFTDATEFIEAHFNDDGSFSPNLIDTEGDVEYVFYGLLALGSCQTTTT